MGGGRGVKHNVKISEQGHHLSLHGHHVSLCIPFRQVWHSSSRPKSFFSPAVVRALFGQSSPDSSYIYTCHRSLYLRVSARPPPNTSSSFMTLLYFFKYIKHRVEPSSKLRPPFPRADRSLLRVRGRNLSVYADMSTMKIQISLKFHSVCAASKVLQNYNDLGLKEVYGHDPVS